MIETDYSKQTILAKLLATENIQVHVGNYNTAFFDVKNRILGLPEWNFSNKNISDLMVAHEVGHALWTPDSFREMTSDIPFSIINVVEDVRIERMIKDKYLGLSRIFLNGYRALIQDDFFKLEGKDPNCLKFIDRLNLKAKCHSLLDIDFSDKEKELFDRCFLTETFEDVIQLSKEIYQFIKEETEKNKTSSQKKRKDDECNSSQDGTESDGTESDGTESDGTESDGTESDGTESDGTESDGTESESDETESETQKSLDESLKRFNESNTDTSVIRAILPSKEECLRAVVPYTEVLKDRQAQNFYKETFLENTFYDARFSDFMKKTKREVQYLISNFERKKSAHSYSRAQESITGNLNLNKIHSYKFEDRIFKTTMRLPDSKDHGMMFFVDYSSSMSSTIGSVIQQLIPLVIFCRKCNIPFRVYGFTTYGNFSFYNPDVGKDSYAENKIFLDNNTSIIELMSSLMNKEEFNLAVKQMMFISYEFKDVYKSNIASKYEDLGGTPLISSIYVAHHLVDEFKKKHKVEKMNIMVLSDGESFPMFFGNNKVLNTSSPKRVFHQTFWRNSFSYSFTICGHKYTFKNVYHARNLSLMIYSLRKSKNCEMIGYFVSNGSSKAIKDYVINNFRYNSDLNKSISTDWATASARAKKKIYEFKKNGYLAIDGGMNYSTNIMVTRGFLNPDNQDDFKIDTDTTDLSKKAERNKIVKKFAAFNSSKKNSKQFLTKFIEIIS